MLTTGWTIPDWQEAYASGKHTPDTLLQDLLSSLTECAPTWTHIVSELYLQQALSDLSNKRPQECPLYGIPFAVKDNIDVAGLPTSAACPDYAYEARHDAATVAKLRDAGAIVIGKTNLDQFATGLVGTRSPYGAVPNSFNKDYISGGSSSGSAVAVANGLVPFSLGTDTAGSGRVPASFNNIVGLKPTKGRFSTAGVVPACRSIDCVSVFALSVADAHCIAEIMQGEDVGDGYSREPNTLAQAKRIGNSPTFAVPASIDWFGDTAQQAAWQQSLIKLKEMGTTIVEMDFTPMLELAQLLYGGAWVAERGAAVGDFIEQKPGSVNEVVGKIIRNSSNFSAIDAFNAEYNRAALAKTIQEKMKAVDALLVPTTPRFPTQQQVADEPILVNSQLGTFTNFVNLADCSALSLPAGIRSDGLPFGITLIAPAWNDLALAEFGHRWQQFCPWQRGALAGTLPADGQLTFTHRENCMRIAVVGAHLTGMPLNYQLTELGAQFVEETTTSNNYRLYALADTTPAKPALVRAESGQAISLEIWQLPMSNLGAFFSQIPAPLGLGSITLHTGESVKGFICEAAGIANASDVTEFGGWKNYIASIKRKVS
ncbi:allophanate hydrolase [Gilvimarinus sp. SDUM040013]|uniref:Allophanate hydrolase n=1 Tax=Gilvimarinus gilvus TaxID=3058038 RepID=A0ABU4S3P3_9GAMM|nr:allophanate hydrolase [Gilvimarinus sp. SDUM040013]MDO3384734.1 allophanate hydrolase [Gilvimarinus sp. SDUM040013]MDX6850448.1 allophanate hydrolase [Gilvimarinus sp. SDUM040013]